MGSGCQVLFVWWSLWDPTAGVISLDLLVLVSNSWGCNFLMQCGIFMVSEKIVLGCAGNVNSLRIKVGIRIFLENPNHIYYIKIIKL